MLPPLNPDQYPSAEALAELGSAINRSAWLQAASVLAARRAGWIALGYATNESNRPDVVAQSRIAIRRDPMGRNAIRIWESFVIGAGLKWTINPRGESHPYADLLWRTLTSPANRAALTFEAQRRAYRSLLSDGEIYTIIFFGARGTAPKIRYLYDSNEFMRPIVAPDDPETILYYPRVFTPEEIEYSDNGPDFRAGSQKVQYIRAWDTDELTAAKTGTPKPPSDQVLQNAVCLRTVINQVRHRGWPMTEPAIDWIRAYKGFMEDRVTFSRAIARFAWSLKGDASETALREAISKLDAPDVESGNTNLGVGKVFGSTGYDINPIRVSSGGMDSRSDGRMIRQQVGAGMGITEPNLTGDPSVGNLASLTAMDGTMAKNFQTDQRMMLIAYKNIFTAILTYGSQNPRDVQKAIEWIEENLSLKYDPVVGQDNNLMITSTLAAAPYLPNEWVQRKLLQLLGEEDPDIILATYPETNLDEEPPPTDNDATNVETEKTDEEVQPPGE